MSQYLHISVSLLLIWHGLTCMDGLKVLFWTKDVLLALPRQVAWPFSQIVAQRRQFASSVC